MRFIYVLVVLFFIGCSTPSPKPSIDNRNELKKNMYEFESRSSDRMDEIEKKINTASMSQFTNGVGEIDERLKIYKDAYDGTIEYLNGVNKRDYDSTAKAIGFFNKAIRKDSNLLGERRSPLINKDKGLTYGNQIGDFRQSINNLNYYLHLTIGKSYFNLCRMRKTDDNIKSCEEAIWALDKSIEILEKNSYLYSDPYYHKGMVLMELKQMNPAQRFFKKAIKINMKGRKYYEHQIKKYGVAIKISDSEFRAHLALAVIYLDYGTNALYNNGKLNEKSVKWFKNAKIEFLKVLAIDPEYDSAFHNLGETEYRLKNYQNAINYFNKALFINPMNVSSYLVKGYSLLKQDKQRLACFNFNIAIKLDKNNQIQKKETYDQIKRNAQCP